MMPIANYNKVIRARIGQWLRHRGRSQSRVPDTAIEEKRGVS